MARVRLIFAGSFIGILLITLALTLSSVHVGLINDKVAHFLAFFALSICCYWTIEGSRRRSLNLSLIFVTGILGVGSEILQGVLPNGRIFDPYDIVANISGSITALVICSWYHRRMLERRRRARYHAVPNEDGTAPDLELGEGSDRQETGVTDALPASTGTLEEQIDNWDENVPDDWDEESEDGRQPSKPVVNGGPSRTSPISDTVVENGHGNGKKIATD